MAIISNQAQLSYNGRTVSSNVATGEIIEPLTASKSAFPETYAPGDNVTYVINVVNNGAVPVSGVSVTDDLGGYTFGEETLYPLTYKAGSAVIFENGTPLGTEPTVSAGPPLVIGDLTIPAGGNVAVIYTAEANSFAPMGLGASIENTATIDGAGITPITASSAITPSAEAELDVTKEIAPQNIRAGGNVTYTFTISNHGSAPADTADNVKITDTLDPVLTSLSAAMNGEPMTRTTNYTYDETSGLFETVPGFITVPAAEFTQESDGSWSEIPGTVTLTISGTIS